MNMRYRRLSAAFLCLSLALLPALGCALPSPVPVDDGAAAAPDDMLPGGEPGAASSGSGAFVQAEDMTGRTVGLSAYAERVVVLDPAACEILCAIGAEALLVGRGWECDYPETIVSLPPASTQLGASVEQIVALAPSLIVASADTFIGEEQLAALNAAGIPIAYTDARDISGVYTAITLLGALTGRTAEAGALVAHMVASLATLRAQATENGSKTVYFELSPPESGLSTGGNGTILNDLAVTIGLRNEFEDVSGWTAITADQVIGRNPDYIVAAALPWEDGAALVSGLLSRAGWEDIDAVRNNAVFHLAKGALTRPGPRLVETAAALLEAISGP